jgi:hypothetical protein
MKLAVRPVTPALWPALEDLFGKQGACHDCWCMYWRLGPAYYHKYRRSNRRSIRALIKRGPPPGLLAFHGNVAVGWCQLTPRSDLGWLEHGARYVQRVDDLNVWSVSCFFVRRGYRRCGVMSALIVAAVKMAKRGRAPALEAYPIDKSVPDSSRNLFTGVASAFANAGFQEVARRSPDRPIMRYDFKRDRKTDSTNAEP